MSGVCSAHIGHDPTCSACSVSSPEEAQRAQAHFDSFTAGVERGAEAVDEWLEGAQWDDAGQPCKSDSLLVVDAGTARTLARLVRDRFCAGRDPILQLSDNK
jgi:hypothetical protein